MSKKIKKIVVRIVKHSEWVLEDLKLKTILVDVRK